MQPYAKQGDGAILRVGDRTSIFNSGLTYFLGQKADELAKRYKKTFKYQRALMPGGTCEATVYDVYGYTAARSAWRWATITTWIASEERSARSTSTSPTGRAW